MTSTNNKKSPNKSPRGVTLVELMVVMAVLSIVLGLIYSIFISQMQSSIWREELSERKQNLDGAMNLMLSEFIRAEGVMNTGGVCEDNIKIKMRNGFGDYDTLQYKQDTTNKTLLRIYNGVSRVVAENISDLKFRCYNQSGEDMYPSDPDTFDVSNIRRITIALTGQTTRPVPGSTAVSNATITGSIQLRNMPTYAGSGCGILYFSMTPANVAFCDPPGQTSEINVRVCDLDGLAMDAMGENAVRIYPKGGLPVDITGTGITYDEGVAVMTINAPENTACMNIPAYEATVSADLTNAVNAAKLTPGTGVELVAVWKPLGCSYEISTSRSLRVEAGDPFMFAGNTVGVFVDGVATNILNACQSEKTAELKATVTDACGNPMSDQTVDFAVLPSPNDQRGYIGTITENNGTFTANYNAGSLANASGVAIRVQDLAIVNAAGVAVYNTIELHPHTPTSLVKTSASLDDPVTLKNCINNSRELFFEVQDACGNSGWTDQRSELTAWSTDQWTQLHGGGVGPLKFNADDSYSVIYNTSSTHCGPTETAEIHVDHSVISGNPDLDWNLSLTQCDVPGLNLQVTPTSLVQGCGQASAQVTATVLLDSADPERNCEPAPAGTDINVDFEMRNVTAIGPDTDWGISDSTHPNGRFLIPPAMTPSAAASTTVSATSPIPAITNVIAWDAAAGDQLYVRAKAVVPSFTNGSLPDFRIPFGGGWEEYATPITILNGADAALELFESSWVAPAIFYEVPLLVDPMTGLTNPTTGYIYAQVMDCDENEDPDAIDSVIINLESDNAGFTNSLDAVELWEVDPTVPGVTMAKNTGYFRAEVPMKRVAEANKLHVDKGARITVDYTDDDDGTDIEVSTIDLTGCRELLLVDNMGTVKNAVTPSFINGSGYYNIVEGASSFRLRANAPTSAGDGITNTTMIQLPQGASLLAQVCSRAETGTPNTVYLIEEGGDSGVFIINTTLLGGPHPEEFMFVGEDAAIANDPAPGGDTDLGVYIDASPDTVTVVVPATGSTSCNTDNATVVNYGCFVEIPVKDMDIPRVTLTPPASTIINSPDNADFHIYADDGYGIINSVVLWICNGTCPDDGIAVAQATPNASTFNQTVTFDTSEYADGYYDFWATASDTEGNVGTSIVYNKRIGNYCKITDPDDVDGIRIRRDNSGVITISGKLKLNDVVTDGTVDLEVTDGDSVLQTQSIVVGPSGAFSWTSSPSAMVAAVSVYATGAHEMCNADPVTDAEYCEVTVKDKYFTYEDGTVTVKWAYNLGGSGYTGLVDTLFANANDGQEYDEFSNVVYNNADQTWTSDTNFGMANVTMVVGGQHGECYFEAPSFVLNAPTCEINVTEQYPHEDGKMTVGWKMLLDGADHVADLNAVAYDDDYIDSASFTSVPSALWTTTTQFANDVTIDLRGEYGVCNATDTVYLSPFTCTVVVNDAYIGYDGRVFADWTYLMNGTTHSADSMVVITNSVEPQDKGTFTGVGTGNSTWTSTQQYANNVNVYAYGQFGACNATASQTINPPTCQINTSSTLNPSGTVTYTWSYLMNGATHDADTMTIVTNSVSDPDDGTAFNNVLVADQPKSWTTGVPYTNTVTADLTGQFGVCNATDTLVVTPPAPTCNVEITSGPTYDITDGTVSVNWNFLLNNSVYNANTLIVNADSGIGESEQQTYNNYIGPYSWTTTTAFTNDVALRFSGTYSDTCSFTNTIAVPVPACEVEFIGSPSYNILDGKVTADWRFLKDSVEAQADVLNAAAYDMPSGGSTLEDVNPVATNINSISWTTSTDTWSSDVTVDIGGNRGVCVAPTQSQSVHVETCQAIITSAPIYNVMDGSVTVDWEYRLDGSLYNATLDASASDLDGNSDSFAPVVANSTSWTTVSTPGPFTNDVTVDVSGKYGVCNATDTATVIVPQCELVVTAADNTDGTVTVDWEFLRGGAPQAADLVSITTTSLTDPTNSATFSGINGTSWTSSNRYTSDVTVTVDGNYGVCVAPTVMTTVTPPVPWCDSIVTSGPTYDITNGTVSVGWDFRLNGLPYVANTMTAVANGVAVGESDNKTFNEQQTFSWASSDLKPFTDDVTIYLTGAYSTTCTVTNTIDLDVPACTVQFINGTSYNYTDGTVTADWRFLIDGAEAQADVLNAVASDVPAGGSTTEVVNPVAINANSVSWTTGTTDWPNDVTVYAGGNRGVCVAPSQSVGINVPVCEVEITGSIYNFTDGTVTADWKFLIDSVEQQADVLNAVASDVPAGGSTTEDVNPVATNANSVSWTTGTTDWPNDVTVDVGGNKGVCVASTQSTTVTRPVCTVEITNTSYNLMTDGSVTADWRFMINGVDAQAEVLNAVATDVPAGGSTTEAVNPVAINVNSTSWTTGTTDWPNDVTVDVGGNYGVCVASAVSNTVHVNTCQAVINSTSYDVSDGSVTVEWSYYLDGSLQAATLDASANDLDGNIDNTFAPVVAPNTSWTTDIATAVFTNDVTVDVSGQYGVCNAADTQTVTVPQCEINVTSATANSDGTVTVDWEFLRGGTPQAADSLSIATTSAKDPADGTTTSGSSGSWTSSVIYTDTVTVTVDGDYGVCVAPTVTNTVTPPVPSCNVKILNGPSYDIDSGQVSTDWQFLLNNVPYVANTMTADADSGIGETDGVLYNDMGFYSWTTAAPTGFTNDVTLTFDGQYSDTCSFTNAILVDVPSCEVEITGSTYNFSDGSVTANWKFLIDSVEQQADVLNAVATDGATTEDVNPVDINVSNTSWTTGTTDWPGDVTVYVGGNRGVCVAPAQSKTITKAACTIDFISSPTYDINNGKVTADWRFMINGVDAQADVLNAAAYDIPSGGSTIEEVNPVATNVNSTSWNTTTDTWSSDVTVDIGGNKGVCVAPTQSQSVYVNTCAVNITGAPIYNVMDGSVTVDWEYRLDGSLYNATLDASASDLDGNSDSFAPVVANNTSWTTVSTPGPFTNDVTVDVSGKYGVCNATDTATVVVPQCELVVTATDNTDGTVTVDWEFQRGGAPQAADLVSIMTTSLTDPADGGAFSGSSGSWTSSNRYTSDVTVTVDGNYGVCEAPTITNTVTPPAPWCDSIITSGPTYDITNGTVSVDWYFRLNGFLYNASTMKAIANGVIVGETDSSVTYNDQGTFSWASSDLKPFTDDLTIYLTGQYSTTCSITNTVTLDVPACTVNITGSSYDYSDGTVTADWEFLIDGVKQDADVLNAVATDVPAGGSTTEDVNPVATNANSVSWTTGTTDWPDDVTVYAGGNRGVCVAPAQSVGINVPVCEVEITGSTYNFSDGTVTADWKFKIDGVEQQADVLNAVASDVPAGGSTTEAVNPVATNANSVSWTTGTTDWPNDVTVDVGGNKGVCVASAQSTTITRPVCTVEIMDSSYNVLDGKVSAEWRFMINGVDAQADVLNAVAYDIPSGGSTIEDVNPVATNVNSTSWTTSIDTWSSDVTVDAGGNKGVCVAPAESASVHVNTCQAVINSTSYDVSDGSVTVEWSYYLDGSLQAATLDASANDLDGNIDNTFAPVVAANTSWTTDIATAVFTNDVTVDVSGQYGVCNAADTQTVTVPQCEINVTANDNPDGTVTVDWEFLRGGTPQAADSLSIATTSAKDPADGTTTSGSSGSWTSSVIYTDTVDVALDGNYGVCLATNSTTITPPVPTCNVKILNGPSYDVDSGQVSVDWQFLLNNVPYVANTMTADADSGIGETSGVIYNDMGFFSWTTAAPTGFTNDVTLTFDGQYSDTCSFTNSSIVVDVPACEVNITGSTYNFSNGSVTTNWSFLMDGLANAADVLNAVASDLPAGGSTTETVNPFDTGVDNTSWTTGTTDWPNDVTVYVGGNRGVCVAPTKSTTITIPACTVDITGSSYNVLDGKVTTDWTFLINGSAAPADVLNAVASDVPAGGSTTEDVNPVDTNVDNTSWTTGTTNWTGEVTVYAGGNKGVCVAPAVINTVDVATCAAVINSTSYDVGTGQVTVEWSYYLDGSLQAATLNATASDSYGKSDSTTVGPLNNYSWTTDIATVFTNDVTVDVGGEYGVCNATDTATVVVPQCEINITSATADPANGRVTVDWEFLWDSSPQAADNVSITLESDSDPTDGTTTSGSSGTWTSGVIFTNGITVTVDGNYGVCNAPTATTTVAPKSPECDVSITSAPSYDINTGEVTVGWQFLLNNVPYVANSMIVNADSGIGESAEQTYSNAGSDLWTTTGKAFTNDVALTFNGSYSDTCSFTNSSISVAVPECTVEFINGPSYDTAILNGSVTAEWRFLMDGIENTADILNAVASYGGSDESFSDASKSRTSLRTSTAPWPNDVTVYVGGNKGVCVAPAVSNTISKPECWVEFTYGPVAISNGAADMSWRFMVDGAPHIADVLNATADDGYTSDFYSTTNTNSTSWSTGVPFTNDIAVDIGAEYGVCQVTNSVIPDIPPYSSSDCEVNITSAIYNNTDGHVEVDWEYLLFGSPYMADSMVANATNPLRPSENTGNTAIPDPDADGIYAWDTSSIPAVFSNDVTVRIDGTYGACSNFNTVTLTRPICNSMGGYYTDGTYSTQATYHDVPLLIPPTDNKMYVQLDDCDENEDRYNIDYITADLASDNAWNPADTETFTLAETGANTGIFRGEPTITRNGTVVGDSVITVDPGSIITGTYTDNDDPADTGSGPIPVSGCREMSMTDGPGNPIWSVQPDPYPYASYSDGASAFHVIVNAPMYGNNGSSGETYSMRTNSCEYDSLSGWDSLVDDEHSVTLRESGDTGMFTIDSATYSGVDYIYVGADHTNVPAPGGSTAVGLRVGWDPTDLYATFPDFGAATCEPWNNNNVINYGCYSGLWAEEVCQRDLNLGDSHSALLGIAGGACTSPNRGGSYYSRMYDFTLNQNTYVNIDVVSPGSKGMLFDTYTYLTGGAPPVWEGNDDGGTGTNSRIRRWLPAGSYSIDVTSYGMWEWGDFTVTLTDHEAACPLNSISVGAIVDDTTNPSCGATEMWIDSGEYYSEHYSLSVATTQTVEFNVQPNLAGVNPAPWPQMYIYDITNPTQMDTLVWGMQTARLSLDPGKYIIEVFDSNMEETSYDYTLSVADFSTINLPLPTINATGIINGTRASINASGSWAEYYEFTLASPQIIHIEMVNSPVASPIDDPNFYLLDADFNVIDSNDTCGSPPPSAPNACITRVLPAGTYIIEATTPWGAPDTGRFLISLYAGTPPTPITLGTSSNYDIDGTQASTIDTNNFAHFFELTLASPTVVNIDMTALGFPEITDPYIAVYGTESWPWYQTDTCNRPLGPNDACLSMVLPAGTYLIEATTTWGLPETGKFGLSVYDSPLNPISVGTMGAGGTLNPTLDSAWTQATTNASYYEFTLGASQTVYIDMVGQSPIFDSELALYDDDPDNGPWSIDSNSDCWLTDTADRPLPKTEDACITRSLPPGTYIIEATTPWGFPETGGFDLSVY